MSYNYFTYDYLYAIEGADLSTHNMNSDGVDFELLASRIGFLYLRGLYTKYEDYDFSRYIEGLKPYPELPLGYYQFLKVRKTVAPMKAQFAALQKLVAEYGLPALGLVFDLEASSNPDNLTKVQFGDQYAKYLNWSFAEWGQENITTYTRDSWWDWVLQGYKTDYPKKTKLWIARYHDGIPVPYDKYYNLPDDWWDLTHPPYLGKKWIVWQHSADGNGLGAAFGVNSAAIDLLRFNGSGEDFYKLFGVAPQKITNPLIADQPDPPPDPEPEPEPPDPPVGESCMKFVVTTATLNVRNKASTYGTIVGKLSRGTKVVAEENVFGYEGWVKIKEGQFAGNYIAVSYHASRLAEPTD